MKTITVRSISPKSFLEEKKCFLLKYSINILSTVTKHNHTQLIHYACMTARFY